MTPFFFGESTRQLFGVYDDPPRRPHRDTAVVLCYPLGKEYMRSHWAFRQLASALVRDGFHVLRFDYRGTGDSAGDSGEGEVSAWREDVIAAAEELQDTAGTRHLSLVGLRFGATLAAVASSALKLRDLVLWDPVVCGTHYLRQLRALHQQLVRSRSYFSAPRSDVARDELLGFLYPPRMARSIEAVDLLETPMQAQQLHLVLSDQQAEYQRLQRHLADQHQPAPRCHHLEAPGAWNDLDQIEHALLVGGLPRTICETLGHSA